MWMNVTRQQRLASKLSGLWNQLMPEIGTPEQQQFLIWSGAYLEHQVVHGMNRAARKALKLKDTSTPLSLTEAVRYASSVMKNEKLRRTDFRELHG
jgi:hypothetical protein